MCFHLDLRETRMNLIHLVRNLFLRKLQALIARLDKTKNELNKTKMEFSSIKLKATRNVCRVYYKPCIAIFALNKKLSALELVSQYFYKL